MDRHVLDGHVYAALGSGAEENTSAHVTDLVCDVYPALARRPPSSLRALIRGSLNRLRAQGLVCETTRDNLPTFWVRIHPVADAATATLDRGDAAAPASGWMAR